MNGKPQVGTLEHVAAGPLVRSSYHADEHVPQERAGTGPLAAAAGA